MTKGNALIIGNTTGYEQLPVLSQWSALFEGIGDILYIGNTTTGEWAVRFAKHLKRRAIPVTQANRSLQTCGLLLILCNELTGELLEIYGEAAAYDVERIIFGVREKPILL
jgi:hypothetical protein